MKRRIPRPSGARTLAALALAAILALFTGACAATGQDDPAIGAGSPEAAGTTVASRAPARPAPSPSTPAPSRSPDPDCAQQTAGWSTQPPVYRGAAQSNPGPNIYGFGHKPAKCWDQYSIRLQKGQDVGYTTSYLADERKLQIVVSAPLTEAWTKYWKPPMSVMTGLTYESSTSRQTTFSLPLAARRPFKIQARAPTAADDDDKATWLIVITLPR